MALTNNLLAFYKLDNTTDSSGNGNTLTNNGDVTFSSGKIGNAAEFTADHDKYLTVGNDLGQITETGFSVSVWFKRYTDTNAYLIDSEVSSQYGWFLGTNAGGSIWFLAGEGSWSIVKQINPDTSWVVDQWHHLAITLNSSGDISYYVDGQVQSTSDSEVSWTPAGLRFGSNSFDSGANLDGQIDAVGIWNRALTEAEVAELYNNGTGLELPAGPSESSSLSVKIEGNAKFSGKVKFA
jgi:hypothetical protein